MVIWSSCSPIRFQLRLLPNCSVFRSTNAIGLPTGQKSLVLLSLVPLVVAITTRLHVAGAELEGRLQPLFDRYRSEPEDNLLSLLLAEENEVDGLTQIELLGACSLLLFAGHDTTASLLGSATVALCRSPDVQRIHHP